MNDELRGERSLRVAVHRTPEEACFAVAQEIETLIRERDRDGQKTVLGLATGGTPIGVYKELVRRHREGLSFANVVTFNLDEYWPISSSAEPSYHRFMARHLFDHVDLDPARTHLPDGSVGTDGIEAECARYERLIAEEGGLDFQLLGIGRSGHIGFNEPGSKEDSRTRLVELSEITREDNAGGFCGLEHTPTHALTIGVGTILSARRIRLLALGAKKASIIQQTIEGPIDETVTATYLRKHRDTTFVLDASASLGLSPKALFGTQDR